jgi:hypothetical protein
MIDDDVGHRRALVAIDFQPVAIGGIGSDGIVTDAETQVLDQHVRGVNLECAAADHDARRGRGLAGDGQRAIANGHVGREHDDAGDFEDAGARTGGVDARSQRARAICLEGGHAVDCAAAPRRRAHAVPCRARDHRDCLRRGNQGPRDACRDESNSCLHEPLLSLGMSGFRKRGSAL